MSCIGGGELSKFSMMLRDKNKEGEWYFMKDGNIMVKRNH